MKTSILALCLMVASVVANASNSTLDNLFSQLQRADQEQQRRTIERNIWTHWSVFPDSSDSEFLYESGVNAMQRGELRVAVDFFDKVITTHPDFAEVWNKRATVHFMLGNFERSVSDIIQTLTLEPRHFGAMGGLLHIYFKQERYDLALNVLDQLRIINPYTPGIDVWEQMLKTRLVERAT